MVVGGEQAQDDDDGGAEEHGGVAAERAPAQRADQRADDRRAGVEMPHEDIRPLAGEDVAQHAAAHAGDEADEDQQEQRIILRLLVRALHAHDRKDAEADRVHHEQQPVKDRLVPADTRAHMRQKHQNGDGGRRERIDGVLKCDRRRDAEDEVTDDAAAHGRADPKHDDAEQVHLLLDADDGAGHGEGDGSDQLEHKDKDIRHGVPPAHVFSAARARRGPRPCRRLRSRPRTRASASCRRDRADIRRRASPAAY